jgi:hypothetical protein
MIAQFSSDWNFYDVDEGKTHGASRVMNNNNNNNNNRNF